MRAFACRTLRGSDVSEHIRLTFGLVQAPDDHGHGVLAIVDGYDPDSESIEVVALGIAHVEDGVVIVLRPDASQPDVTRELVLVQEYSPGTGAKRWPAFGVDWQDPPTARGVCILSRVERCRGSGSDVTSLILAPAGWAANIAVQFRNERDAPAQVIAVRGLRP